MSMFSLKVASSAQIILLLIDFFLKNLYVNQCAPFAQAINMQLSADNNWLVRMSQSPRLFSPSSTRNTQTHSSKHVRVCRFSPPYAYVRTAELIELLLQFPSRFAVHCFSRLHVGSNCLLSVCLFEHITLNWKHFMRLMLELSVCTVFIFE